MSTAPTSDASLQPLLDRMIAARQLSSPDAAVLIRQCQNGAA